MATPPVVRSSPQIDSKIKQLQSELQHKVQNFDGPRRDLREELAAEQTTNNIQQLMQQFATKITSRVELNQFGIYAFSPTLRKRKKLKT